MKSQTYMDRALRARDPRYYRVLARLGYQGTVQPAEQAPEPEVVDVLSELRSTYQSVAGKRPFHGWDADTLREKIAALS